MYDFYEVRIDEYPDFKYHFEDIRSEAMKLVLLEQNQEEVTLKIISNFRKRSREHFYVVCFSRDSLLFTKEITHRGTMKLKVETKAMLGGINRFILFFSMVITPFPVWFSGQNAILLWLNSYPVPVTQKYPNPQYRHA